MNAANRGPGSSGNKYYCKNILLLSSTEIDLGMESRQTCSQLQLDDSQLQTPQKPQMHIKQCQTSIEKVKKVNGSRKSKIYHLQARINKLLLKTCAATVQVVKIIEELFQKSATVKQSFVHISFLTSVSLLSRLTTLYSSKLKLHYDFAPCLCSLPFASCD